MIGQSRIKKPLNANNGANINLFSFMFMLFTLSALIIIGIFLMASTMIPSEYTPPSTNSIISKNDNNNWKILQSKTPTILSTTAQEQHNVLRMKGQPRHSVFNTVPYLPWAPFSNSHNSVPFEVSSY